MRGGAGRLRPPSQRGALKATNREVTRTMASTKSKKAEKPAEEPGEVYSVMAVCIGTRRVDAGGLKQSWEYLTEDGQIDKERSGWSFTKKGIPGASAGSIYKLYKTGGSTYLAGGPGFAPEYQGRWADAAQVAAWQAIQFTDSIAEHTRKVQAKEQGRNEFREACAPLRAMLDKLHAFDTIARRREMVALILTELWL